MGERRVESRRRLCLVVDVERYGGRSYAAQEKVQDGVAHALDQACRNAGLSRGDCERQDRGDGQLLLLPPEIDEDRAVPGLIHGLRDMLPLLNARVPEEHLIRLRVALAQGAVRSARLGFVAWSVELASRLLDSAALRKELAAAQGSDMALIVPDDLYHDLFERGAGGLPPETLRKVRVEIKAKKFAADAWLGAVPRGRTAPLGFPVVPLDAPLARPPRSFAARAGEAAVLLGGTLLMLPAAAPPQLPPPPAHGDADGHGDAPAHPVDRSAGTRAADTAEALASTADHVVDGPHPYPDASQVPHDWGELYAHPADEPHRAPAESEPADDDDPDDADHTPYGSDEPHPSPYDHHAYDSGHYVAQDDTDGLHPQDDLTDPYDSGGHDPGHGGFPADAHHPDW
ncbi:hypothetical protein [Streptomyces phaeofaciens]|uniref:hypothetical protein n=1 Tax=Streptomyces phaeofaciens TaxID=68254 RepID=UPI0036811900